MSYTVLKPKFIEDFSCKGGACRNTCCFGWRIDISKAAYSHIKSVKLSPELSEKIGCIERLKEDATNDIYARIKLNEHNKCDLQTEDGLCMIQLECGYKALPPVCKIYPRMHSQVGAQYLSSLQLTCEVTLEMLAEIKEPLVFVVEKNKGNNPNKVNAEFIGNEDTKKRPILKQFQKIQSLCIDILQARIYDIEDRLVLLGIIVNRLTELENEGDMKAVEEYIAMMEKAIYMPEIFADLFKDKVQNVSYKFNFYKALFDNIDPEQAKMSELLEKVYNIFDVKIEKKVEMMSSKVAISMTNSKDTDKLKNALKGVSEVGVNKTTYTYDVKKHEKANEAFNKFAKENPHFIENILVTAFFGKLYPFGRHGNLMASYIYFANVYAQWKMLMGALMLEDDSFVNIIDKTTVLFRPMLNSAAYEQRFSEHLQKLENFGLANLVALIRS